MNEIKENLLIVGVALMIALIITGIVWVVIWSVRDGNEKSTKSYTECKTKTSDLEWCFKQFQPYFYD